jgi:hypothetical protein
MYWTEDGREQARSVMEKIVSASVYSDCDAHHAPQFDRYAAKLQDQVRAEQPDVPAPSVPVAKTTSAPAKAKSYADERIKRLKEARLAASKTKQHDLREELTRYLNDTRLLSDEEDANILLWWKVSISLLLSCGSARILSGLSQRHAHEYPILARMARDYLSIQASSVGVERVFSSAGITQDDKRRNALAPETFGALQLIKDRFKVEREGATEAVVVVIPAP